MELAGPGRRWLELSRVFNARNSDDGMALCVLPTVMGVAENKCVFREPSFRSFLIICLHKCVSFRGLAWFRSLIALLTGGVAKVKSR